MEKTNDIYYAPACDFTENELLQYASEKGILDMDAMLDSIEEMKDTEILKQHKYAISKTTTKDGSEIWYTYLPLDEGGRLYRRRNTRKELERVIINHYKAREEKLYLDTVFYEWVEQKLEYGEIQRGSYDRYITDYKRFFVNSDIADEINHKQFKNITEDDLERFIKLTIKKKELTQKAYSGLRILIRGMFKYAKKRRYTTISITQFFGDLDLQRNSFKRRVVDKEKEVFSEDEVTRVTAYLRENPDIVNTGLLLAFETGLRVGELSTLKRSDIHTHFIRVQRSEDKHRDKETDKWTVTVKDYTKSDAGDRDLIIPSTAQKTLAQIVSINPDGEYLFERAGKRLRGITFNKRLTKICDELNIPHRTPHKIRKTYGTTLIDSNVEDGFIAEQMGHKDISTTRKLYYFSNKNQQHKETQIENAISF